MSDIANTPPPLITPLSLPISEQNSTTATAKPLQEWLNWPNSNPVFLA